MRRQDWVSSYQECFMCGYVKESALSIGEPVIQDSASSQRSLSPNPRLSVLPEGEAQTSKVSLAH